MNNPNYNNPYHKPGGGGIGGGFGGVGGVGGTFGSNTIGGCASMPCFNGAVCFCSL